MRSQHPVPEITPANEQQFAYARDGVLALQYCDTCDTCWFLASTNCPTCLSTRLRWKPVSGRGHVWSWIVMHQEYLPGFEDELPYLVAAIVLDEGPMLMSTLVGIDSADVTADMAVRARFEAFGAEALPMPVFEAVPR